jgi:hypothetical protein
LAFFRLNPQREIVVEMVSLQPLMPDVLAFPSDPHHDSVNAETFQAIASPSAAAGPIQVGGSTISSKKEAITRLPDAVVVYRFVMKKKMFNLLYLTIENIFF